MTDLNKPRAAADAIVEIFEALLGRAQVPPDSEQAEYAACLTLTIFEQFRSAMCLVDANLASHAAGPIRSMLEGVADLQNLCHCSGYTHQMRYESARENVALFEEFGKSENVSEEMRATLAEWDAHDRPLRDELKAAGFKELKLKDKLRRIDLEMFYSYYRVLCALVHPNLTSLRARHRSSANLVLYRAVVEPPVIMMLLRCAVDLLMRAIDDVHLYTDLDANEVHAATDKALQMWRDADPDLEAESLS
ncbi:DUF5677 domain-containing protein [Burkholderia cepacia]|uniref:DUF5677 domain-containing protein n=1 Tax=Burkholderia cepacia TaxID=292 RepID=UPI0009C02BAD|nr:DUF5677 domain-containing protein [Burkholderia cepacia]MDN7908851.1 DUF5677 domain-containing protein [Burkholderia cepacia]OUE46925.1 hypothetical protein BZY94_07455 [Burkholderia territorii]HDR9497385.1 hypothetical protein [Burkholderia cepacia]